MLEEKTKVYKGTRPDALTDWSTNQWTKEVGAKLTAQLLAVEYEQAVKEQKKELREAKARAKSQEDAGPPPNRYYPNRGEWGGRLSSGPGAREGYNIDRKRQSLKDPDGDPPFRLKQISSGS